MRHPEYYRGRAEETRVIADCVKNKEERESLLKYAQQYEDLVRTAIMFHRLPTMRRVPNN